MKREKENNWIKWLDIGRLITAVAGLFVVGYHVLSPGTLNLDYMLSNVVAIYVFLMGVKTLLLGNNKNLAWFYMFFSAMMFVAVNMIWFRFGE